MVWQPYARRCSDVDIDAAALWAESGAQWLTAAGVAVPARLVAGVVGLTRRLDERGAGFGDLVGASGVGALASRAAVLRLQPSGRVSCGGSTRLLPAADGWIAVSMARLDDLGSLPAWLGLAPRHRAAADATDLWPEIAAAVRRGTGNELVELGSLLGLACAVVGETVDATAVWLEALGWAPPRAVRGALVVNLASLWAGPLAADLLRRLGAEVIAVEGADRPDGARATPEWFAAIHAGQRSVALDLRSDHGVEQLTSLLGAADVVIEGSRPRALEQLGLDATTIARTGPQLWVSLTGHGRRPPESARIAFGDDAAAAGGLVGQLDDGPVFIADAVADPLAGLTVAATVVELLERGGRWLVDVALARVAAGMVARSGDAVVGALTTAQPPQVLDVGRPRPPLPLGRDTAAVLAELEVGAGLAR